MRYACKGPHTLFTGQRVRERERRERKREREKEGRERVRERELFLFLKEMMSALHRHLRIYR